ncbi:hypothetical protein DTV46_24940 [Salmonella enterica subsp. salamae]|nr:hypothetical protein [Salmonella enterica subsp. salamae]
MKFLQNRLSLDHQNMQLQQHLYFGLMTRRHLHLHHNHQHYLHLQMLQHYRLFQTQIPLLECQ